MANLSRDIHGEPIIYKGREVRDYTVVDSRSEMGRSSIDIQCPYCGTVVTAYIWSLAANGKKCTCGAKHLSRYQGTAAPPEQS